MRLADVSTLLMMLDPTHLYMAASLDLELGVLALVGHGVATIACDLFVVLEPGTQACDFMRFYSINFVTFQNRHII